MNEGTSAAPQSLRLLLVDDNPCDRELLARELRLQWGTVTFEPVLDAQELQLAVLAGSFDASIVDYQLNWSTGIEVLHQLKQAYPYRPVVMFTASGSESVAVRAMKEGLDDYLIKGPRQYARLPLVLQSCLERARQREGLQQAASSGTAMAARLSTNERSLQLALKAAGMRAWDHCLMGDAVEHSMAALEFICAPGVTASGEPISLDPRDLPDFRAVYDNAIASGEPFVCEVRVLRPAHAQMWLEVRGQPLREAEGRVTRVIGVSTDITQRKRADAAQARLAAIVEFSADAIVSQTLEGTVESWNAGAERLFGYPAMEMIGQPIGIIVPPECQVEEEAVLARVARGEFVEEYETERVARGGHRIAVAVALSAIRDPHGRVTGASKTARDITERRRTDEALRAADHRKDVFIATLAHELRNPLAPIRYATRLLEPGVPEAMAADARVMIDRQLAHMARLLDELLDVSRITRGVLKIHSEPLDLRRIVEAAVKAAQPLAHAKSLELRMHLSEAPLAVSGDEARLTQIIGNLINNAIKYTGAGGHIVVDTRTEAAENVIRVSDDGVGIAPELLPHVFELFVQGESGARRADAGLGVGLSLAHELVVLHGGRIEAISQGTGRGSEFIVRLPRIEEAAGVSEPLAAGEKITVLGAAAMRVLVVDDNVDAANSLADVLTLAGFPTKVAYEGVSALELAELFRPAIVLLDIGLPNLSGYEIARRLRSSPESAQVRLIAITGWGQEADRRSSQEAGFDEHLTKPVDPQSLLQLISRLMQRTAFG